MAVASLELSGVSKRFDNGMLAVDGLDLRLEPGSFTSVLGASGCGKSTVLRMIAGLSTPTSGRISRPSLKGSTSFVFQDPTLMPWTSARSNVSLPLDLSGMPKMKARQLSFEALASVGLSGFEDAFPSELSGGMRMRVSLARAIVTKPQLLLLDEPFAALDEITRFKLNNDLRRLWRHERFTAVFVTHSVFESVYLSERVIVMSGRPGRIFEDVPVRAPEDRSEAFRTSEEYAAQCRNVSESLERAMLA